MTIAEITPDFSTVAIINHKIAGMLMNIASGGRILQKPNFAGYNPVEIAERINRDVNKIREAIDEVRTNAVDRGLSPSQWQIYDNLVASGKDRNYALNEAIKFKP